MEKEKIKFIYNSLGEAKEFSKEVRQYLYEIEKKRPLTDIEKELWKRHIEFMFEQKIRECLFKNNMMIFTNTIKRVRDDSFYYFSQNRTHCIYNIENKEE